MKRWILIGMVVASGMTIQAQNKLPEKFPYQDTSLTAEERADGFAQKIDFGGKGFIDDERFSGYSPIIDQSVWLVE